MGSLCLVPIDVSQFLNACLLSFCLPSFCLSHSSFGLRHSPMPQPILPGSSLGVLGSGQLGRMFTIAARRLGYRVHTFSPDQDTPTGQVADREITAPYEDLEALRTFAKDVA